MRRKIFFTILLLIFSVFLFSEDVEKINLKVSLHKLKNGLTVIIAPIHDTPIIYSLIRYKVGSVNEHVGITGISHMCEHMMFKGTKEIQTVNYQKEVPLMKKEDDLFKKVIELRKAKVRNCAPPDVDRKIKNLLLKIKGLERSQKIYSVQNDIDVSTFSVGFSRLSADTSFDRTHYYEYFPSNCLEAWAYFESSRMREPVFREFYSERNVVLEEYYQTTENDPDGFLFGRFLASLIIAHPYHWDVIGWKSDIINYTREKVYNYHKKYYAPNNAIIVLVGDVYEDEALKLIKKYFGSIKPQKIEETVLTSEPPQRGEKRIVVRFNASPRLMMGFHKCQANSEDQPVFDVIEYLLSHGRSSILYKNLIGSGKASYFYLSQGDMKRYPGIFYVYSMPNEGVSLKEIEGIVWNSFNSLKHINISNRELLKAKKGIIGNLYYTASDKENLAVMLAEYYDIYGDVNYYEKYIKEINKITKEDIRRVARKYFVRDNCAIAYLLRPGEKE